MPQLVDIPGVGTAEFPDGMSPEEMASVIKRDVYAKPAIEQAVEQTGRVANMLDIGLKGRGVVASNAEPEPVVSGAILGEDQVRRQLPTGETSTTYGGPPKEWADSRVAANAFLEGLEGYVGNRGATEPVATLPRIGHKEDEWVISTTGKEMYNMAAGLPEFGTSRLGMLALFLSSTPLKPLVSYTLPADMLHSAKQQANEMEQNWENMTPVQKRVALLNFAGTGAMALGAGKHAAGSIKNPAINPILGKTEGGGWGALPKEQGVAYRAGEMLSETADKTKPLSTFALDTATLQLLDAAKKTAEVAPLTAKAIGQQIVRMPIQVAVEPTVESVVESKPAVLGEKLAETKAAEPIAEQTATQPAAQTGEQYAGSLSESAQEYLKRRANR